MIRILLSIALLLPTLSAAERWNVQYYYDEDKTQLQLVDLAFPSATRGIAVGWIVENNNPSKKVKPTCLTTSDGGAHWTQEPLKDEPRSIFFLNDSLGWMVTESGLWLTEESGHTWRKIFDQPKPNPKLGPVTPGGLLLRVAFLDEKHGFAVGYQKAVLETHDGGRSWTPVAEAAKPVGNPAFTAYTRVAFDGKLGLIVGAATPPRRDVGAYPSWMEPERASKAKQQPNLTLVLQTRDSGATWTSSQAPLLGLTIGLRMSGDTGMSIFGFAESFDWPSEATRIDLNTGKSTRAFREKNRRVTDAALFPGPIAVLAAVEPSGRLNNLPIPGKVRMLRSTAPNLEEWQEIPVDYRAVAGTVVLAGPDPDHLWAATDTGMILHLAK
ncbi:MAG TPA: YCF48-related protein [Bryobacteraceae bacterium]|jgi:hypothetical protein